MPLRFVPQLADEPIPINRNQSVALVEDVIDVTDAVPLLSGYYTALRPITTGGYAAVNSGDVVEHVQTLQTPTTAHSYIVINDSGYTNRYIFKGTPTSGAYTSVKTIAGTFASSRSNFAAFGEVIIYAGELMYYSADGSTSWTALAASTITKPISVCVARNHVFVVDEDTNQLFWSAEGDYTNWRKSGDAVTAANASAGFQRLIETPGSLTCILPFQDGVVVFKTSSTYRGTYIGPPFYWRFDLVSQDCGVAGLQAATVIDQSAVVFINGTTSTPYIYDGGAPRLLSEALRTVVISGTYGATVYGTLRIGYVSRERNLYLFSQTSGGGGAQLAIYNMDTGLGTGRTALVASGPITLDWGCPFCDNYYEMVQFVSKRNGSGNCVLFYINNAKDAYGDGTTYSITYRAVGDPSGRKTIESVIPLVFNNTPSLKVRASLRPANSTFTEDSSGNNSINTTTYQYDTLNQTAAAKSGRYIGAKQYASSGTQHKVGPIIMKFTNASAY